MDTTDLFTIRTRP